MGFRISGKKIPQSIVLEIFHFVQFTQFVLLVVRFHILRSADKINTEVVRSLQKKKGAFLLPPFPEILRLDSLHVLRLEESL